MTKRYYNPYNETVIIAVIIIILSNIYVFLNDKLTLSIGIFSNIFIYIEVFYAILLIFYNILLLAKDFFKFKDITKYKLKKYFPLANLIILTFYICKEPLFFYSTKKIILVSTFLLIEIFFTFFIHKIKFKFRGWEKMLDEIFVIASLSIIIYYLQYISGFVTFLFSSFVTFILFLIWLTNSVLF